MRCVGVLLVLVLVGCSSSKKPVARMEPSEAMGQLRNDFAVLWDVRDAAEIAKTGAAQMAKHVPAAEWVQHLDGLSKDKVIVVYDDGEQDPRAERVADDLAAKGFRTATLASFDAWKAAKLPIKIAQ